MSNAGRATALREGYRGFTQRLDTKACNSATGSVATSGSAPYTQASHGAGQAGRQAGTDGRRYNGM